MSHLHVAEAILLDSLTLPLKDPVRVSHGVTCHHSAGICSRNVPQEY